MWLTSTYLQAKLKLHSFDAPNLELGSGPKRRKGWVTVDMCRGADIYWDLRLPLPIQDSSFSFLYTSHVIEHFTFREFSRLVPEMYRVLKPGGAMSYCVPDARVYIDLYNTKNDPEVMLEYGPAVISKQPMDVLNYMFYMDGQHKQMFDPASLIFHLTNFGFVNCREREFDPSIDMPERRPTSFYIECQKPLAP